MTKIDIANRFLQIIISLFGITLITFSLIHLAPGDPVTTMYLSSGTLPREEVVEQTREAMGLNEPLHVQYFVWLKNVLQGDLGKSYSLDRPVVDAISSRVTKSFNLAVSALLLTILISFPLGILAAIKKNTIIDYAVRFYTFIGVSTPGFLIGTLLLYFVALKYKLLPVISTGHGVADLILPSVTLAISMSAKYIRQIRTIFLTELDKQYVAGAKSRGIKFFDILVKDVLPNTLTPLVTLLALSFGSLLSGVAAIEVIFSYPGIGSLAVESISSYDYPLIQAYVLIVSLFYMLVNFLVDVSYPFLDPTIVKGNS